MDETQDFTQAELWLLMEICERPNEMFLAGDTAQAIMHGISFRFSDLASLFRYYAEDNSQKDPCDMKQITLPVKVGYILRILDYLLIYYFAPLGFALFSHYFRRSFQEVLVFL